jgi:PhzF family phenazine biosynthesis protein
MEYYIVDAFTDFRFSGNSAAVCLLNTALTEVDMQRLAGEFNLSETAYLRQLDEGCYSLRWFTPTIEVNLCGHATLAAAHVLWEQWGVDLNSLRFLTRSGELLAQRSANGIALTFPSTSISPCIDVESQALHHLAEGVKVVCRAGEDLLIELADEAAVVNFTPNFSAIAALPARGLIITAAAKPETDADFVSRFFGPAAGIDEDPVTGSAHCALAPYWSNKLGLTEMRGLQLSARRGEVGVAITGDKVVLSGQAVTVMTGKVL